jgi:hypothetical protein
MKKQILSGAVLIAALALQPVVAATIDFDDLSLAPDTYFRTGASTSFTSGGATFYYDAPYGDCCWSGFTYSSKTDTVTPGYLNDGSAITGDGAGAGQDNYAIGNADGARLEFDTAQALAGAYFSNTTYAYLAMRDGNDGNSPAFVKGPFGEDDFFTLTVTGLDAGNAPVASLDIALADGTDILSDWLFVDLSGLGTVKALQFSFASSDSGAWGVNTPTYFAMDSLTTVPIPATVWLLGSAVGMLGARTRVRRKRRNGMTPA